MEKEFDLGMTEEEFDRTAEDLAAEIDDFDLVEEPNAFYEVWVLGYDENYDATDFEYFIEGDYLEKAEADKCMDYFSDKDTLLAYLENKNVTIPENTKHIHLFLEFCVKVNDGEGGLTSECLDVEEEVKIY